MRILVAHPSATVRKILRNLLGAPGQDVIDAVDASSALEQCAQGETLVITDWDVPGAPGVEFVERLRELPGAASISVLMVTRRSGRADVERALSAGVDGYLLRPFHADALRMWVDNLAPERPAADEAVNGAAAESGDAAA